MEEAEEYSKAYSRAGRVTKRVVRKMFGDPDFWRHPTKEWTEEDAHIKMDPWLNTLKEPAKRWWGGY